MKIKKGTIFALILILSASVIAGCGKNVQDESDSDGSGKSGAIEAETSAGEDLETDTSDKKPSEIETSDEGLSEDEISDNGTVEGETSDEEAFKAPLVGGWEMAEELKQAELPDEAQTAFDAASSVNQENSLKPAFLLAVNPDADSYMILCIQEEGGEEKLSVADVAGTGDGSYEFSNISDFILEDYVCIDKEVIPENSEGMWSINEPEEGGNIPTEVMDAFEDAVKIFPSVPYEPVCYVASQVVAGMNYALICKNTVEMEEPIEKLSVVTVYRGVDGVGEILSVADIDLKEFE